MDQVEDFLTDQDVQESWKFEDFGGRKLLADHVENIRVEWSASYPGIGSDKYGFFFSDKYIST